MADCPNGKFQSALCQDEFAGRHPGRTGLQAAQGVHDMTDLSGKVFVITGGNGGIGLGMAEGIAAVVGFVPYRYIQAYRASIGSAPGRLPSEPPYGRQMMLPGSTRNQGSSPDFHSGDPPITRNTPSEV